MIRVQEQRRAVAQLSALGATFSYGSPWMPMLPYWLQWQINSWLPADDLRAVVWIKFDSKKLKGDGLAAVEHLPHVAQLELYDCPIGDSDLKHLRNAHSLTCLRLETLRYQMPELLICPRSHNCKNST